MRDDRERVRDVLESIDRILAKTQQGREAFNADELLQVWVVHHLQIIGEAVRSLSDEFRRDHPQVPWIKIVGMRNVLVHHYFGIDLEAVWAVVEHERVPLQAELKRMLA